MGFVVGEVDAKLKGAGAQGLRQVVGVPGKWVAGQPYSETGIGAAIPWANRLWFVTYPDENLNGIGCGLWSMDESLVPRFEVETNVTSAARCVLSDKLFIGTSVIDSAGNITAQTGWQSTERPAAFAKLPGSAYLWALAMSGNIWKIDPATQVATLAKDNAGLSIVGQPHGKGLWGHPTGRYLFAALNGHAGNGRLAVFDTQTLTWATTIDTNSWVEVAGSYDGNSHFWATGHDFKSGLFWMFDPVTYSATPKKFRIPLPSRQQLQSWQQEWMRIRAVETERYLMDFHGGFFQLSIALSGDNTVANGFPLLEPVCRHIRTIPDFTFWNGYLVLTGNQNSPQSGNKYTTAGQPNSGLLLTTSDDLWSWGKPGGTGHWWIEESVSANTLSEPMLMNGYDKKCLHLANGAGSDVQVEVYVYNNHTPYLYDTITVAAGKFEPVVFPDGFAADWVAVKPLSTCTSFTAGVKFS